MCREAVTYSGVRGETISQSGCALLRGVKSDKVRDTRKDGSLFGDQPHIALSETLGHRSKGKGIFGCLEPAIKCVRGGDVKAFPSRNMGDPWRGESPGEERLR
jgi:hypothetical protein